MKLGPAEGMHVGMSVDSVGSDEGSAVGARQHSRLVRGRVSGRRGHVFLGHFTNTHESFSDDFEAIAAMHEI
jgi:hypothetical protein